MEFAELREAIEKVELVDAHAHNIVALDSSFPFVNGFSEAAGEALSYAPHSISFKRNLREIAELYGCEKSLQAIEEHRRLSGLESITSTCFNASRISAVLIDDGLKLDKKHDIAWHKSFAPFVGRILRIERLAEEILDEELSDGSTWTLDKFTETFVGNLMSVANQIVGLKSVAAYRSGLEINAHISKEEAEEGLANVLCAGKPVCVTNKSFIDYIFTRSLEVAVHFNLPMQIHTGFGDKDLDLRLSNPLHLRAVLEDERFSKCRLVLLHASYPFSKEASYLASVYSQVYLDFGLAVPKLSAHGMISSVKELLELAPIKKVMFSTDGYAFPETYYLGGKKAREIIFSVLYDACVDGDLTVSEAIEAAKDILAQTAVNFYKIKIDAALSSKAFLSTNSLKLETPESGVSLTRIIWIDASGQHRCRVVPAKRFNQIVKKHGIGLTFGDECIEIANEIGIFPLIIRPAFTLGGTGGGIAYNKEEFESICKAGLAASLASQVLVEKSLLGWKEYELEVMRDLADNVVIICSIENFDPMGVHTGDSITVAPAQTLTDKEYQRLRDYSIQIIREIGVECGGSNVQFAVNPEDGEVMVIEMNPRVSRSSALASKATGFPIAKMAAKLSVGYSLDQIPNDITKKTPASFEPSIDYVVTKIPRFAFEKFPGSEPLLTTQMKSVGESMAIGRTFQESFQKAVRSLECGYPGWGCSKVKELGWDWDQLKYSLRVPNPDRIQAIYAAMKKGMKVDDIYELTYIDKWFLTQLKELIAVEQYLMVQNLSNLTKDDFHEVKKRGFSDKQIAFATKSTEKEVRSKRLSFGVAPAYKRVDTCAAEFEANTPYMYSSYDNECESAPTKRKKVLILGGGPNRIGQGIEFDYCCCHTSFALQSAGYETIMMNSNPETVSTDYDTSDRLYFEPLTIEDVLNVIDLERPDGIIVQFGGQTPLKLALPIQHYLDENKLECASGNGLVRIWGTSPDSIDAAEDRERFNAILKELNIEQPKGGIAKSDADALTIASDIGYPVVVRPSYVLGGRAMEIVYSDDKLVTYLENAVEVDPERPVLIDKYLIDAVEIDVDALADSYCNVVIGGIMEHIEQAGVHSGDSACILPTQTISSSCLATIRSWTEKLAKSLNVCGLMNCQYAITAAGDVFLLEANPRASRTVPFVSKAIGHPLAKYAALVMAGKSLSELGFIEEVIPLHVAVKEAVLPFEKFPGCDVLLGPEMRSTGEVMGIAFLASIAFAKAQIAAGQKLPVSGTVFLSLNDLTKCHLEKLAKAFSGLGFRIIATSGTAHFLELKSIPVERVLKMHEGRPHAGDMLANGQIQLMVITSSGDALDQIDGRQLRRMALAYKVPIITTVAGALATAEAIRTLKSCTIDMMALQDFYKAGGQKASSKNLQSASSFP